MENSNIRHGAILLTVFCMISSVALLRRTLSVPDVTGRADISHFERRIAPLKAVLPPNVTVGYVSDLKDDPSLRSLLEFRMAQYALVPVIVERGPNHPYVVGNFHGPVNRDAPEVQHLTFLRDLGNGVILFRGEQR